jgi:hypothetical protein
MKNVEVNELFSSTFWKSVATRQANGERYGQAVFNSAHELFLDEVGELATTELNPFYNDNAVKHFLAALTNKIGDVQ